MMTSDTASSFDFGKPTCLTPDVEQRLADWQRRICEFAPDTLAEDMPLVGKWSSHAPETCNAAAFPLSGHFVSVEIDVDECSTHWCMSRLFALAMVNRVLGASDEEQLEDRPLTPIETSILEVLSKYIVDTVNDSQDGGHSIQRERIHVSPKVTQLFRDSELVIMCFYIDASASLGEFYWVWRAADVQHLFAEDSVKSNAEHRWQPAMAALAKDIPLDIVVRIGSATLQVAELAALRVGDVIVLDCPISDLMIGFVQNKKVFLGHPARLGNLQAFKIEQLTLTP